MSGPIGAILQKGGYMQNKRWRVLIVDDEIRIGMLIRKLIHWDELSLECVAVLDNGQAAYDMILVEKPDIVITDVRMPKIDGLQLIEMVKENQGIRFIIVSGYREFEFAQKAIKHSVRDYLLKPINEEELNQSLAKLCSEISDETEARWKEAHSRQALSVSEQIIRGDLLSVIISQNVLPVIEELRERTGLSLGADAFRALVIKADHRDTQKADKKLDRVLADKILSALDKAFDGWGPEKLVCEQANFYIHCLLNYPVAHSKEIKDRINIMLIELQDYSMGFDQHNVTVGIGRGKTRYSEISGSLREAHDAVNFRIKAGTSRLIYAKQLALDPAFSVDAYLRQMRPLFLQAVDSYSETLLRESVEKVFDEAGFGEDFDYSRCYDIARRTAELFFNRIDPGNNKGDSLQQRLLEDIYHCSSVSQLKGLLSDRLAEYLQLCLQRLVSESTKPVREAKKYIDEHYGEKIGLEDIAGIVGFNPTYFSMLFKKETGINVSAYLVNVRMEAAKKMLRETNEIILAIADSVGYKDSRYFSQLFVKTIGIKPALYRKLHS